MRLIVLLLMVTSILMESLRAYDVIATKLQSATRSLRVHYFFTVLMFQKWLDMIKIYLDKYQEIFGYFSLS
jgi:hypothetical protein